MSTKFWLRNLKGSDFFVDLDMDGKIIFICISKEWDMRAWKGFTWLSIGTSNETPIYMRNGDILD
jgi:hypothetical protein